MSLPILAQVADVQARMPRALTTEETTRAGVLLVDASARVRAHVRQTISRTQTTAIIPPNDNQIVLPERPVISVDAVARVNADGKSFMPYSVWTFDGRDTLMLGPPSAIINAPQVWTDMDWFWRNVTYQIQYTHGYATIPDDIVGIVASMVMRVIMAPGSPGVQSETIGGYSYRMMDGYPTAIVTLSTDEAKYLTRVYGGRRNRTIELR
ncbi:hypothetical protein E6W39_18940 [Kitasatospora acidiphila]|uniref:Uncharacterized protein n=1 Tax=Kitasatospora acidiphila TaxID=2567942 RepID=A0A540W4G7_9ACTN|nr:hypothetical protein [Kitasatospora acidiphila]TQF03928.1 hypothetical protein E6W39_18940 [Kitasatospora acidiphila]